MKYARSQPESDAKVIAEVRRFNRLYTRQLGLLDRHLLDSAFTLTEARVLYELAQRKSTIATKIAADLVLDLGSTARFANRSSTTRMESTSSWRRAVGNGAINVAICVRAARSSGRKRSRPRAVKLM